MAGFAACHVGEPPLVRALDESVSARAVARAELGRTSRALALAVSRFLAHPTTGRREELAAAYERWETANAAAAGPV